MWEIRALHVVAQPPPLDLCLCTGISVVWARARRPTSTRRSVSIAVSGIEMRNAVCAASDGGPSYGIGFQNGGPARCAAAVRPNARGALCEPRTLRPKGTVKCGPLARRNVVAAVGESLVRRPGMFLVYALSCPCRYSVWLDPTRRVRFRIRVTRRCWRDSSERWLLFCFFQDLLTLTSIPDL